MQRVSHRAEFQRAGKIVSTAGRDDQYRKLESHQRWEVTVNGAVPAEE